jgi:hypothetical protein
MDEALEATMDAFFEEWNAGLAGDGLTGDGPTGE